MSLPDALMPRYFQLTTGWHPDRVDEVAARARGRATCAPVEAKRLLARTVVDLYHGEGAGEAAEAEFDQVFRAHEVPTEVPEHAIDAAECRRRARSAWPDVLRQAGLVPSNKEGVRMIGQGGVRLDGEVVADADATSLPAELDGVLVQVGKRTLGPDRRGPARRPDPRAESVSKNDPAPALQARVHDLVVVTTSARRTVPLRDSAPRAVDTDTWHAAGPAALSGARPEPEPTVPFRGGVPRPCTAVGTACASEQLLDNGIGTPKASAGVATHDHGPERLERQSWRGTGQPSGDDPQRNSAR